MYSYRQCVFSISGKVRQGNDKVGSEKETKFDSARVSLK